LSVGGKAIALGGELLVEGLVEEQDLTLDGSGGKLVGLVEAVDYDDLGGEAVGRGGNAAAEGGENDFLRRVGGLAGPGGEGPGLFATDPVGTVVFSSWTSAPRARISAAT